MSNTIDSLTEPVEAPRRRVEPYLGETCREKRARAEEALAEVGKARDAWLQAAKEAGRPIPVPRYRPVIYQSR